VSTTRNMDCARWPCCVSHATTSLGVGVYARRTGSERAFATIKDTATTSIARGRTHQMGLTPLMLWIACLLITRNQRT
jgi:hypothetical protein